MNMGFWTFNRGKILKSLIQQYKNNIRKIISNMTGSYNEDIEQEVYIKTWKNMNKYKEQGKFKSWISTITANLCRDYMKSSYFKNTQNSVTDEETLIKIKDENTNIEDEFIKKQRQIAVVKAVEKLKPKFREVIVMYEMMNMNYEQIAEKLNCPVGTVRSRLFNARKELSITLKDLI